MTSCQQEGYAPSAQTTVTMSISLQIGGTSRREAQFPGPAVLVVLMVVVVLVGRRLRVGRGG